MNRLQLKTLLLSVITEIKFGQPLAPNAKVIKRQFKNLVGLPNNATNQAVLNEMSRVYAENKLSDEFERVINKFNVTL